MHSMLFVAATPDHGPRYSQIPQIGKRSWDTYPTSSRSFQMLNG
jgi:hypothetical protein